MGTRGLTVVIQDGTHKVAQYGQWDHNPSGQGADALKFLSGEGNIDKLIAALPRVKFGTDEDFEVVTKGLGIEGGWMTSEQAKMYNAVLPFVSRDHGAGILALIAESEGDVLIYDQIDFARDSLFCENAYVVDLDARVFEVYAGFQTEPHTEGRFHDQFRAEDHREGETQYQPVKLVASFPLDELPSVEDFVAQLEPDE